MKNKFVGTLLTVLIIPLIMGYYFLYKSQKEPIPSYAVDENYLFAEVIEEEPELKLLWDGEPIRNFYSTRVRVWNDGDDYLDSSRLYTGDPIRIEIPPTIKILNQKIESKSRQNLDVSTLTKEIDGQTVILINIAEGEALEPSDGFTIKMYFTSDNPFDFEIKGRVKGVPNGFGHQSWTVERKAISPFNWIVILSFPVVLFLMFLRNTFTFFKLSRMHGDEFKEKYRQHKFNQQISISELKLKLIDNAKFAFLCMFIFYVFMLLFPDYSPVSINPAALYRLVDQ